MTSKSKNFNFKTIGSEEPNADTVALFCSGGTIVCGFQINGLGPDKRTWEKMLSYLDADAREKNLRVVVIEMSKPIDSSLMSHPIQRQMNYEIQIALEALSIRGFDIKTINWLQGTDSLDMGAPYKAFSIPSFCDVPFNMTGSPFAPYKIKVNEFGEISYIKDNEGKPIFDPNGFAMKSVKDLFSLSRAQIDRGYCQHNGRKVCSVQAVFAGVIFPPWIQKLETTERLPQMFFLPMRNALGSVDQDGKVEINEHEMRFHIQTSWDYQKYLVGILKGVPDFFKMAFRKGGLRNNSNVAGFKLNVTDTDQSVSGARFPVIKNDGDSRLAKLLILCGLGDGTFPIKGAELNNAFQDLNARKIIPIVTAHILGMVTANGSDYAAGNPKPTKEGVHVIKWRGHPEFFPLSGVAFPHAIAKAWWVMDVILGKLLKTNPLITPYNCLKFMCRNMGEMVPKRAYADGKFGPTAVHALRIGDLHPSFKAIFSIKPKLITGEKVAQSPSGKGTKKVVNRRRAINNAAVLTKVIRDKSADVNGKVSHSLTDQSSGHLNP